MTDSFAPEDGSITIKVASPVRLAIGKMAVFNVTLESTVLDLKNQILSRFPPNDPGPAPDRQRLIFRGQLLEDSKTIATVLKEACSANATSVHFHLAIKPLELPKPARTNDFSSIFGSRRSGLQSQSQSQPTSGSSSLGGSSAELPVTTAPESQSSPPSIFFPSPAQPAQPAQQAQQAQPVQVELVQEVQRITVPIVPDLSSSSTTRNAWASIPSFGPTPTQPSASSSSTTNYPVSSASSFTSNTEDVFTVQMNRTQSAGILDISRFAYAVTESGVPTINFLGPYSIIIPIPVHQVVFVRNYSGELLCCLSPEALKRLSLILNRAVETEPLYSRTPIYSEAELDKPTYDPELLPTSRNIYLSFPRSAGSNRTATPPVPTPTQTPVQVQGQGQQAQANDGQVNGQANNVNGVAAQPHQGVQIRFGQRNFDLNFQLIRDNARILSVLFRVYVFVEVFAMQLDNALHIWAVSAMAFLTALWHAGMLPQLGNFNVGDWLRNLPARLPHIHPEVPPPNNEANEVVAVAVAPAAAAAAGTGTGVAAGVEGGGEGDHEVNEVGDNANETDELLRRRPQEENANADATANVNTNANANANAIPEEPESRLNQILWSIQGVLLMFIGSLFPFVYDRWVREDRTRREHAEQRQRELQAEADATVAVAAAAIEAAAEEVALEAEAEGDHERSVEVNAAGTIETDAEVENRIEGTEKAINGNENRNGNSGDQSLQKVEEEEEETHDDGDDDDGGLEKGALSDELPESIVPEVAAVGTSGTSGSLQYSGSDQTLLNRNNRS